MTENEAKKYALCETAETIRAAVNDGFYDDEGFQGPEDGRLIRAALGELAGELLIRAGVQACKKCGCSQDDACDGGCSWVEPNLCSACAGLANGRPLIEVVSG